MPPKPQKILPPPAAKARAYKPRPSEDADLFDRIESVGDYTTGIKALVYGRGKTGKSRFAASFRKPVLFIASEDGTKSVVGIPGVDIVRVRSGDEFTRMVRYVAGGGKSKWAVDGNNLRKLETRTGAKYVTVAVDTAGGIQDLILKDILCLDKVPLSKFRQAGKGETWGIADQGTWGTIGTQFKERFKELMELAERVNLDVVVIAHERNFKRDDDKSESLVPTVGAALTPNAASWLNGEVDYICQTYIREEEVEKDMSDMVEGAENVKELVKTGKMEFCLRVGPHNLFMTGFRQEFGSPTLPDSIVNPTYEKMVQLIRRGGL